MSAMRRRIHWISRLRLALAGCLLLLAIDLRSARADEVRVAVAANFAGTLEALAPLFKQKTGHALSISVGATGALYAQIKHGAPFDVFLSADAERPKQLEQEGLGVPGTRLVYAQGKLVLWSPKAGFVDAQGKLLQQKGIGKVGIADPATAPYGAAAKEVLSRLGAWERLSSARAIVIGSSVSHAFQFAASGNASCAFVALSQLLIEGTRGSRWEVPQSLYTPLNQEAILLKSAAASVAAATFLAWLDRDPAVLAQLRKAGYGKPKP
jgi:molybdate transport system substrate-binding protein